MLYSQNWSRKELEHEISEEKLHLEFLKDPHFKNKKFNDAVKIAVTEKMIFHYQKTLSFFDNSPSLTERFKHAISERSLRVEHKKAYADSRAWLKEEMRKKGFGK